MHKNHENSKVKKCIKKVTCFHAFEVKERIYSQKFWRFFFVMFLFENHVSRLIQAAGSKHGLSFALSSLVQKLDKNETQVKRT